MSEQNKHMIYDAAAIERYLSGKMLPAEMHAIEKAALDDPLLSEAIEGYDAVPATEWQPALNDLKIQFEKKINTTQATGKVRSMSYWKAAAAVLVLGGIALATYFGTRSNGNIEIAQAKNDSPSLQATTEIPPTVTTPNVVPDTTINNNPVIAQSAPKKTTSTPIKKDAEVHFDLNSTEQAVAYEQKDNASRTESLTGLNKETVLNKTNTNSPINANQNNIVKVEEKVNNNSPFNSITPDDNKASTNVSNYSLNNNANLNEVVVTNAYSKKKNLTESTQIISAEDIEETETNNADVVKKVENNVTNTKKLKYNNATIGARILTDANIVPIDGWNSYDLYVKSTFQLSKKAKRKNTHGTISLSFTITPTGKPTSINITQTDCIDCNNDAIKLLENGPMWKSNNPNATVGKLIIQF
ncbi:MAG: energy transducer TonB [Ferruginibacter sp.]